MADGVDGRGERQPARVSERQRASGQLRPAWPGNADEVSRAAQGDVVILANFVGTALFAVTAGLAAIIFTTPFQWVAAITALLLFAIGVFSFLWAYYNAVVRSRRDEISVLGLYLLVGAPTPSRVRRLMLGALLAQITIAAITTFTRLDGPDGEPGSSLALGFIVPMFGFGLNGLWAAFHGAFPRRHSDTDEPVTE